MNYQDEDRQEFEQPLAVEKWGWRYHHLGIPTDSQMEGENYLPLFKLYVSGFEKSPFGVEWMRFEADSPVHELVRKVPHLAFEVDDLDKELSRLPFEIIIYPNVTDPGIRVAFIVHNGAPVELIEFRR
jgi:hypothetical protein